MATGIQLKYNGASHYCLKYAKFAEHRESFSPEDVKKLFGHKLDRLSKILRSRVLLTAYGMLCRIKDEYRITTLGKDQLMKMAKIARANCGGNDD